MNASPPPTRRPPADPDPILIREVDEQDRPWVSRMLADSWASTTVVAHGVSYDAATLPGLVAERTGRPIGLLTYRLASDGLEVVTLDAVPRNAGVGSQLLAAAVRLAATAGAPRVWLVTTNDNLDAIGFYQRRGLRLVAVSAGAVDRARTVKPAIPLVGQHGIEIHDELVLERRLR